MDVGNRGCCALAASLIKLVVDYKPQARINLLYGNRSAGVQQIKISDRTVNLNIVNYRLSPKARLGEHLFWILFLAVLQRITPSRRGRDMIVKSNHWLRCLRQADFVGEIRGGDSFSDIYGLRRFLIGIAPCIIAILMDKKLVMLPQTYGPFNSRLSRLLARFILKRAHMLYSRDYESVNVVRQLLGANGRDRQIRVCPDVAFVLGATLPEKPKIEPPDRCCE